MGKRSGATVPLPLAAWPPEASVPLRDGQGSKADTNAWKMPRSLFFRATAQTCKFQTLNKDKLDDRLHANLQGRETFASFPLRMPLKIATNDLLCCLRENLLCYPVHFIPATGFFKTFLGTWSCFSVTAVRIHVLHRCMGNVNGYRG